MNKIISSHSYQFGILMGRLYMFDFTTNIHQDTEALEELINSMILKDCEIIYLFEELYRYDREKIKINCIKDKKTNEKYWRMIDNKYTYILKRRSDKKLKIELLTDEEEFVFEEE